MAIDPMVLSDLIAKNIRPISGWDTATPPGPVWTPPLNAAEQVAWADLQTMLRFGIATTLTLAEFQAMKPDLATGKTYLGLANPTNAQTVAAVKAIIRTLGALLRS